jgi:4-hydroxybenzoyl-CoA reductase subunit alpha
MAIGVSGGDGVSCDADLGSYSSCVTLMAGNAAVQTACEVKRQLPSAVSDQLGVPSTDLLTRGGKIFVRNAPDRAMR